MDKRKNHGSEEISEKQAKIVFWCMIGVVLLLLLTISGCDVLEDFGKRSVNEIPIDGTENCTDAHSRDDRDNYFGVVRAHDIGHIKITASIAEQQDEVYVIFYTERALLKRILDGDPNAIPKGCDNWGFAVEEFDLNDGYDTNPERVTLRPPDYWDEDRFKSLSLGVRYAVQTFWNSQGVNLDVETSETEAQIQ